MNFKKELNLPYSKAKKFVQSINQGTQNLNVIYKDIKAEKEVMNGTSMRQSIVRSSVLPTVDKGTQVKTEIQEAGATAGLGLGINIQQSVTGKTTIGPSFVKTVFYLLLTEVSKY